MSDVRHCAETPILRGREADRGEELRTRKASSLEGCWSWAWEDSSYSHQTEQLLPVRLTMNSADTQAPDALPDVNSTLSPRLTPKQ